MPYKDIKLRNERSRQWALTHPERKHLAHRRCQWKGEGMNPDQAQVTYESTDECEICGKTVQGKNKQVDHNRKTGQIRGVLCSQCNVMLGMAHEDAEILRKAIEYLTRTSETRAIREQLEKAAEAIGAPSYVSFDGK